jgi:ACS family D-galactonate transporter-like MFS transporter
MTATLERKKLPSALLPVLALLGISVFINYIDRGNLSIAAPLLKDELNLTPGRLGLLLSAFFWTYACLQPVYGWLVDRLNVYWLLAGCYCLWSLATAATGLVHTFVVLFILRLLVGLGEAVSYPSYSKIIALNFSEEHRGIANAVIQTGLALGPGFGMLLGGSLMARFGWRPFFIVLGLVSLLWLPAWIRWMPRKNVVYSEPGGEGAPSLLEFLSLRSAWGTCICLFSANYVNYFLLTWLPYYLVHELHFSIEKMSRIGALGYLICGVSALGSGWMSDRWIRAGASPTLVRKSVVGGSIAMAGVLLGFCAIAVSTTSVVLVLTAMIFFGASAANIFAISQTLAGPQAAGRWVGFQNGFGNLAGVVVPTVTGFVVGRTGHFSWAFVMVTLVTLIGSASMFFLIGPVEQVRWGKKAPLQGVAAVATSK